MLQKNLLGGLAVFAALLFSAQVFAQVEQRQDLMKGQSAANKAIKGAVEAKDFATIEAKAKDLMGSSEKIVGAFPKGSDKGKTKATAAISLPMFFLGISTPRRSSCAASRSRS